MQLKSVFRSFLFGLIAFLAAGVAIYGFSYLLIEHNFIQGKGEIANSLFWQILFYMHFIGGSVALGLGWIQFSNSLRRKKKSFHRVIGQIYIIAILAFGATGGLGISFYAFGRVISSFGFGFLALAWIITTYLAYKSVKNLNYNAHKNWMIRSYSLTYAAVTLRLYLPLFIGGFGMDFENAYEWISWVCWVPNLAVAEILIKKNVIKM